MWFDSTASTEKRLKRIAKMSKVAKRLDEMGGGGA